MCAKGEEQAETLWISADWEVASECKIFFLVVVRVLPRCDYDLLQLDSDLSDLLTVSHLPISSFLLLGCLQEIYETASSLSHYMLKSNERNSTTLFS